MVRAVLPFLLGALLVACAPELDWRELRLPEAGVSQAFPCSPARQQRRLVLDGKPRLMVLYVCDTAGASWALAHLQVETVAEVPATLRALALAAHANLGAEPGAPQPQAVPGAGGQAAAGRYRIAGQRADGEAVQAVLLLYARGTTVVQLTALGRQLAQPAVDSFLGAARAS